MATAAEKNNASTTTLAAQQLAEHSIKHDVETIPAAIEQEGSATPKDARFWLVIMGLLIATFLSALDLTGWYPSIIYNITNFKLMPGLLPAISTALPTIAHTLKSEDFTWIGNAYSITSTAFIPWAGGLAHIFGRRPILLGGLLFFAVGSAMCGAAKDMKCVPILHSCPDIDMRCVA